MKSLREILAAEGLIAGRRSRWPRLGPAGQVKVGDTVVIPPDYDNTYEVLSIPPDPFMPTLELQGKKLLPFVPQGNVRKILD